MYDVRVIPGPPLPLSALNLQNTQCCPDHFSPLPLLAEWSAGVDVSY